ncbi:hypothetical protein K502DRAFT_347339 [Neoconidiobolus thromboides FSU 785]|nr:hypothetical protein K502DRAFT_347339 [Neoconidiobolus thromboides FSU 785]
MKIRSYHYSITYYIALVFYFRIHLNKFVLAVFIISCFKEIESNSKWWFEDKSNSQIHRVSHGEYTKIDCKAVGGFVQVPKDGRLQYQSSGSTFRINASHYLQR